MASTLKLNGKSSVEEISAIYGLSVGEVFKIEDGYETVMQRIIDHVPTGVTFEVFPVTPGTSLFTIYGANHCVVTSKVVSD